jgi:hypothetical protein
MSEIRPLYPAGALHPIGRCHTVRVTDGGDVGGTGDERFDWDFFVSYTTEDRKWAEWIAWQLEEAGGFRVLVEAWDIVPGMGVVVGVQNGVSRAARTIAVLSEAYTRSPLRTAEWQAAWATDPNGLARKLLVVRVEDCVRPGVLGQVVSFDLFDRSAGEARDELVKWARLAVSGGRAKPAAEPGFPGRFAARAEPAFPAAPRQDPPPTSPGSGPRWPVVRRLAAAATALSVLGGTYLYLRFGREAHASVISGVVSGTVTVAPAAPIDLSAEGTLGWTQWGYIPSDSTQGNQVASSFFTTWSECGCVNQKSGGEPITADLPPGDLASKRYYQPTVAPSWSWEDGSPVRAARDVRSRVFMNINAGALVGFNVTIPASTASRTARIYFAVWDSTAEIDAKFVGDSQPVVISNSFAADTADRFGVCTLTYHASRRDTDLVVTLRVPVGQPDRNIALVAATLS